MTWQKLSISTFPIISYHSNQSSYPSEIKNTTYVEANVLSMYANPYIVSEKKIFKHL